MKPRTKDTLQKFAAEQQAVTCSRLADEECGKDGPMNWPCMSTIAADPRVMGGRVMTALTDFGRERLSNHYFMRDFLYSEIAQVHGIPNVPDDAELAVKAGKALCRNLLEPLRHIFGHVTIRSAFRSANVNGFGNCHGMDCSSNKASYANHIWDHTDEDEFMGATACIVIPWFVDWMNESKGRDWRVLAWFIHDHLPYSEMVFFVRNAAVNLTWRGDPCDPAQDGDVRAFDGSCGSIEWRSEPRRRVDSFMAPARLLIKDGEPANASSRSEYYVDFLHALGRSVSRPDIPDYLKELREARRGEDERFRRLVEERKAEAPAASFKKWRSDQVYAIKKAWSGPKVAPFREKEESFRKQGPLAGG